MKEENDINWFVKEFSQLTKVSVRTLHHYDDIGLLKASLRTSGNYRLYSEVDLLKLQCIVTLKIFGFSLEQIKELWDWLEGIANKSGSSKNVLLEKAKNNSLAFNDAVLEIMKVKTEIRWAFEHGMFSFQAKTPSQLMEKYAEFTLQSRAHLITSTSLILDSEHELAPMQGQAQRLYDHLSSSKTFMYFTATEGAGLHCQLGAFHLSSQRIFDWLDKAVAQLK